MKVFCVLWVVFTVATFMCFVISGETDITSSLSPGLDLRRQATARTMILKNRKLKDGGSSSVKGEEKEGHADLDDYRPIDPSPSSKASIRPGPIQHGTPLMPFVPKPTPPPSPPSSRAKRGGFV